MVNYPHPQGNLWALNGNTSLPSNKRPSPIKRMACKLVKLESHNSSDIYWEPGKAQ